MTFSLSTASPVTVTGLSVTTQNGLADVRYVDRNTTVDGRGLPAEVSDRFEVALRDLEVNGGVSVGEFVDPDGPEADIVVTLQFDDGSSLRVGLG